MKNCDEMVNSLLERRGQYQTEQKRKRRSAMRITSAACCFAFAALVGVGGWQSGWFDRTPPATLDDSTVIGEQDYFDDTLSITLDGPVLVGGQDEVDDANKGQSSHATASSVSSMGADVGNHPNNYIPNGNELTLISSFEGAGTSACYVEPENGKFNFSIPLYGAMEEYGEDGVLYRVFIDLFRDKQLLPSDSAQVRAEQKRLSDLGYTVAYEAYFDGTAYRGFFTIHATLSELKEFAASEDYGYMLFLYDERVGTN